MTGLGSTSENKTPPGRMARCCCGSLTVRTTGGPEHVGACSCSECQRRTGAAVSTNSYWHRDNVEATGPAADYTRKGKSGGRVTFHFCPNCGSTVYWNLTDFNPDWIGVAVGMFVDPSFPSPSTSIWEISKHHWVSIPADHHFEEQPSAVPE